jgi:hypothetical protein
MNNPWREPSHAFVTLFDRFYLARGLLLARSLQQHLPDAVLYVVCLDAATEQLLQALRPPGVRTVALAQVEAFDPRLARAKTGRSTVEYYFTLAPALPRYLLAREPTLARVTYLDADLYFYNDPTVALLPVADASISAIEHRYSPLWDGSAQCGRFNVGLLSFQRGAQASDCLERWQQQCLAHCPDRPDVAAGVYGDQLYLDEWPRLYSDFAIIHHPGANLAPWNVRTHALSVQDRQLRVDGEALLFFHFHGLKQMAPRVWDTSLQIFATRLDDTLRRYLYLPYLRALESEMRAVHQHLGSELASSVREAEPAAKPNWLLRLKFLKRAIKGQYIHL